MKRQLNSALRLGALVAFGPVLAIGGPVHAQVDASISATLAVTPPSTSPDTVVQLVANFQSSGDFKNRWNIGVQIPDTGGAGTLASIVGGSNTSGCNTVVPGRASCIWIPQALNETTTITVNIIVAANAIPASPGWVVTALHGEQTLATTNLEIVEARVDPPVDPPVEPPVGTDAAGTDAAQIDMCHASDDGGFELVRLSASAAITDHGHHSGDIIPALNFEDAGQSIHFAGLSLGSIRDGLTGAQVLAAGCTLAPPTVTAGPDPTAAPPTPTDAPPTPTAAPPSPSPTAAPPTPTDAPPTPTAAPPSPSPTAAPPTPTDAPPTPTLAPPLPCAEGEVEHDGQCDRVPELVVPPTVATQTVTSATTGVMLTPSADCVDRRADGVVVVWFDYELAAPDQVTVERGSENALAPTGTPPTLFGPGVHTRVVSVETRDGLASWTLAGQVASSNDQTRDCDRLATATTDTGAAETTDTGAVETTDTGAAETTDTGAAETTDTGAVETTDTGGAGAGTDGCAAGERLADGECEPVQAVRLLFVDNVMECDGHAVARFAAVNDNPFRLDEATFASTLSPQRLDGDQVTVLERHDEASDDNALAAEFLTVRYITSVTWTVTHHGLEASVSAGVSGATPNPDCPLAAGNATGADGLLATSGTIPSTGTHDVVPIWLIASLLLLSGMVLIVAAGRRRSDDERTADV